MTVRVYVGRGGQGRAQPPLHRHETLGAIGLIERLWVACHRAEQVYGVIVNPGEPSADMVVLTEGGIGVVELKAHTGRIYGDGRGAWLAGGGIVHGGAGDRNPRRQVQRYAQAVRERLVPHLRVVWGDRFEREWAGFKVQTAVCFTHPLAIVDQQTALLEADERRSERPWEHFSIVPADGFVRWAASLRFEAKRRSTEGYAPFSLGRTQIAGLATRMFDAVEWEEIPAVMPDGGPYAYLGFVDEPDRPMLRIDRVVTFIGRDPESCHLQIPEKYKLASRLHAHLYRADEGFYIKDEESTGGTYVGGERVRRPQLLCDGQQLTLGGKSGEKVCRLVFRLRSSSAALPEPTDTVPRA